MIRINLQMKYYNLFSRGIYRNSKKTKSIHETQSLIFTGAHLRIGVGEVAVLGSPWLADGINPYVTSTHPALEQCRVRQLIQMNGASWDVDLVADLFNSRDATIILNTPINSGIGDNYYWKHENSGVYTVKSAYKHIQLSKGNWSADMEEEVWKKLWKIKVPAKVLHFMWKALTGCLPTRVQLLTKHVDVPCLCVFCNVHDESISHVLLECPYAQSCWNRAGVNITAAAAGFDFSLWFETLDQWSYAQSHRFDPLLVPAATKNKEEHWIKPEINKIKVNVDGAIFHSNGSHGIGAVARDSDGQLIEAFTALKCGVVQPAAVEAFGIKEALSWIKSKGWSNVIVETDSIVSVQALSSSLFMLSIFGLLISDCKSLLNCLVNVCVSFVPRSANRTTHCLARGSCYWSDRIFNVSNVPNAVHSAIMADLAIIS
uniref:RNase H type-1 domain-containing protein n=1 Tax=Cannabis sativa TaxID=3483 RepID=A0A803NIV3_CANSA